MDFRTVLIIATVAGFLITLGGLVAAWVGARREYADAQTRIDTLERLSAEERDESNAVNDDPNHPLREVPSEVRHARWEERFAEHGLLRISYSNMPFVAAYESRRLLGLVLSSTGRDFLVAAFGLLVSTAASVGSLFLGSS
ncbi:hypothetical protein [Microbacterium sp. CGR1]|uniref:hypothetical protein n=1 Tax=Microbacterium sp. CGR1 TaxID=1696072 RepID=UPI003DA5C3BF